MPTYSFVHPQNGATRRFRHTSEDRLRRVTKHAHRRRESLAVTRRATERLNALQATNRYFLDADFALRAVWTAMPFLLLIVYMIDVGLFRPVADYLARRVVSSPSWISAVSLLVPFAILGLDIGVGMMRHYFAEAGSRWSVFWTCAGVVLALAMPLAAISTELAGLVVAKEGVLRAMHIALLITLAILSLTSHALLVFGGRPLFEAKAYWLFRWNKAGLQLRQSSAGRNATDHGRHMGDVFGSYSRDITDWNTQNPETQVEAGPFDLVTREELRDWFGYEVVQLPPTPHGTGAAPASNPAPPSVVTEPAAVPAPASTRSPGPAATVSEGENEYLRNILARRVREEEEAVRI